MTEFFRCFAITEIIIILTLVLRSGSRRQDVYLCAFFCFNVLIYLLIDWNDFYLTKTFFLHILLIGAHLLAFSFWLFSKTLFDDDFEPQKWLLGVALGIVVINYAIFYQVNLQLVASSSEIDLALVMFQKILALLFIILGIIEAVRNQKEDLILSRLRFRSFFIYITAGVILLILFTEMAFPYDNQPLFLHLLQKVIIAGLSFYFLINQVELKTDFFRKPIIDAPTVIVAETDDNALIPTIDQELIDRILILMEKDKFYKTEGLTIGQLATRLEVKEYKLRQVINQQLGFRNFNAFLNSYRVREACQILQDPQQQALTILEIAYQLGFNSLAPFNKAFKKKTDMSPTEWRKKNND